MCNRVKQVIASVFRKRTEDLTPDEARKRGYFVPEDVEVVRVPIRNEVKSDVEES